MFQFRFILAAMALCATFILPLSAHAQISDAQIAKCQAGIAIDINEARPGNSEISDQLDENEKYIGDDITLVTMFQNGFASVVGVMGDVLFFELFPETLGYPELNDDCDIVQRGFPFVVFWLVMGGVFFTLRLLHINVQMFGHGFAVVRNKYLRKEDIGQVTPFQSLVAAVSGTVGLGNIAGVAVAITMGGPGAVIWMVIAGFIGMPTKFAEVTLGHKYRHIDENGVVSGGAFYYLRDGLRDIGLATLGKYLAVLFAILCLCGAFGGGNMFQSNQMVAALTNTFELSDIDWVIALVAAVAVGVVLIGGVKRIAEVAEIIVPLMALIYVAGTVTVLVVNAAAIPDAIAFMFDQAFSLESATGGIFGALIMGFRRAVFSNESGVGSAPIVMAATKVSEPVQIGAVSTLLPFIDTLIICSLTGLVITVTGVYEDTAADGVVLTSLAFATVVDWFPIVLSVAVSLFAFTTILTWSYYGERAWNYLFRGKGLRIYHVIFCLAVFFGGAMQDSANEGFSLIVDFSDLALLAMAIPNLIGLYLLSNVLVRDVKDYRRRLKSGEVKLSNTDK